MVQTRNGSVAPPTSRQPPASDTSSEPVESSISEASEDVLQSAQLPTSIRDSIEPSDDNLMPSISPSIQEENTGDTPAATQRDTETTNATHSEADDDLVVLEQQLRIAEKEAAKAVLLKKLQALQRVIETGEAEPKAAVDTPATRQEQEPHTKEPAPTLQKIDFYYGKTLKEHREFVKACRKHHIISPVYYKTDQRKVNIASTFLKGTVSDSWEREYRQNPDGHTWESFVKWLLDQIDDPENRQKASYQALKEMRQAIGQTARQLLHAIEILEDDLPEFSESQKISNWWTALYKPLQRALNATGRKFTTRDEYVQTATTLENGDWKLIPRTQFGAKDGGQRSFSRPQQQDTVAAAHFDNRAGNQRASGNSPAQGVNAAPIGGRSDNTNDFSCWICGDPNHVKRQCNKRRQFVRRFDYRDQYQPKNGNAYP